MKNITFNNNEESDIKSNSYSNMDINYKSTIISNNDNDINDIKTKRIFKDKSDKENLDFNSSSNNIESEIENDLKKISQKMQYKKVDLIENYLIQLKKFGYPEMGKIYLSPVCREQEKTHNFFEFLIKREIKAQNINYEFQIKSLKNQLNTELKKNLLLKKEIENKTKQQNEFIEENKNLKSIINKITSEKNNLSETLKKFESMKTIIINAFETMDYVQTNDMSKMLSRVKGAEKLIETLKYGYNESLEELTKEMNILKNFVIKLNNELCSILDKSCNIDENIYNFSFEDSFNLIKEAFKRNIKILKQRIYENNKINVTKSDKSSEEEDNICFENLNSKFICTYSDENRNDSNDNFNFKINNDKFLSEDIK